MRIIILASGDTISRFTEAEPHQWQYMRSTSMNCTVADGLVGDSVVLDHIYSVMSSDPLSTLTCTEAL